MKSSHIYRVASHASFSSLPRSLKIMNLVTFLYMLGWGIAGPFFVLFLKERLGSYTSVGFVWGLLPLFAILTALVLGEVLDSVHKRSVVRLIMFLYLPFSALLLLVSSLAGFVIFRFYHSLIATSFWVAGESYIRYHSVKGKEADAIGSWDFASGLSAVIGGIIGAGLVYLLGWNILYAVSVCAFVAFVASWWLPDHDKFGKHVHLTSLFTECKDFFADKRLFRLSIVAFLWTFGVAVTGMMLPLMLDKIGASLAQIGFVSAVFSLPVLAEPWFARIRKKYSLLFWSIVFCAVLFAIVSFLGNVFLWFGASFLLGLGFSAATPALFGSMTKAMPKSQIGELSSVLFAVRSVGAALGPFVAGILSQSYGLGWAFAVSGLLFIVALFVLRKRDL
ncbi:MAG: MFS transporter [Candidatus Woesearchaeota archaeon]|nr:MFS transporter [Candidatus Woesearchaeota archaeon]